MRLLVWIQSSCLSLGHYHNNSIANPGGLHFLVVRLNDGADKLPPDSLRIQIPASRLDILILLFGCLLQHAPFALYPTHGRRARDRRQWIAD